MRTPRHIRSFVLRAGRTTPAQTRALTELWPDYGWDFAGTALDLDAIFARRAHRCLEIGFGVGEVIGALAEANPHIDYLGVEVHRAGIGRLLLQADHAGLRNLRVICHDAVEVLRQGLACDSLDEILIFFPDPWHKKRHHKRRLIEPQFAALVSSRLRQGGVLRLATDWQPYAEQMLAVCNANPELQSLSADMSYVERPSYRAPTRFERRGARLGHGVWDLAYTKRVCLTREEAPPQSIDDELDRERSKNHA